MKYGEVVGPGGKHWHVLQRVDPKAEEYYEQQRKYLIDGTPFPHPAHVSPYTGEPYDPLWGYTFDKKTREKANQQSPLFQAAGMFEINEARWADSHDEYIADELIKKQAKEQQ